MMFQFLDSAEQTMWMELVFFVVALFGFTLSCRLLIQAVLTRSPAFVVGTYSKTALRVERSYKILTWGIMTALFLASFIKSMIEVYFSV